MLEEQDSGDNGVGEGQVEEADERVVLFVGGCDGGSAWQENERIR